MVYEVISRISVPDIMVTLGFDAEQAEEFLRINEQYIADAMSREGWEAVDTLNEPTLGAKQ
tara:strand:+ start:276 stop:458 length:183 start_codon:yes stop_codon:yes gene_type:complete